MYVRYQHFICRRYGEIVEFTKTQLRPNGKVRIHASRRKNDVFGKRRIDNLRRTRQICVRRVFAALDEYGCPLLVTLTFAGDASDAAYANRSLSGFQLRLRTQFPNAQSLFIPELSPRGRIHFHGLLFNVPLHFGDIRKGRRTFAHGEERKTRVLAKLWGEGYVDAVQTDGSPKLAYYISKYIAKGAGHVLFNAMRILRISHGFPKETVIRGQDAVRLARIYAHKEPLREWTYESSFLGMISRKRYKRL